MRWVELDWGIQKRKCVLFQEEDGTVKVKDHTEIPRGSIQVEEIFLGKINKEVKGWLEQI